MEPMAYRSRRLSLVSDAIEVVLRRLSALPPSPEAEELRAKAEQYQRGADGWKVSPPAAEERDRMSKGVLNLHVEVAKLERAELAPFFRRGATE
jgi:hypothetical protein